MFDIDESNPTLLLARLSSAIALPRVLREAAHIELGNYLSDGPKSLQAICEHYGYDEQVTAQFLDVLAACGVIEEEDGEYHPTLLSDSLDSIDQLFVGIEGWHCWSALDQSLVSGKPVFENVHGTDFFSYLAEHPGKNANWQNWNSITAEQWFSQVPALLDVAHDESVCDVGGGNGELLKYLLAENPGISCALLERTEVGADAGDNISLIVGDMFQSIPPGFDTYILCRVFCNWGDEEMLVLLSKLRGAMKNQGRLVIIDGVLPPRGDPARANYVANSLSLFLMFGGRIRELDEFHELLGKTGFSISSVNELPCQSGFSLNILVAECR